MGYASSQCMRSVTEGKVIVSLRTQQSSPIGQDASGQGARRERNSRTRDSRTSDKARAGHVDGARASRPIQIAKKSDQADQSQHPPIDFNIAFPDGSGRVQR